MALWSALRTWWTRGDKLVSFVGGNQAGRSIAALKVALAVALLARYETRSTEKTSLSDLEKITGLSRPMVVAGIKDLEGKEILEVDRSGYHNRYRLTIVGDDNWGKLPTDRLSKSLPEMPNRGAASLAALKLYVLLVARRPNGSASLAFGHEKIREATGVQTRHVKAAIDILVNHGLIHLSLSDDWKEGQANPKGRHNVYTLLGITP